MTTKILWSGLTGRTGREAMKIASKRNDIEIAYGLCRTRMNDIAAIGDISLEGIKWFRYDELSFPFWQFRDVDVIIDFSNVEQAGKMVTLAVMLNKPLILGTSGLSDTLLADIKYYTNVIPVFRDSNFCFKVKKFIDEAVKLAMTTNGGLTLYENFYEGKSLPSETSKVVQRRISEATGKTIGVSSTATLSRDKLVCDWRIGNLHCRTVGFSELAHDVLEIAKVMAKKPIKKGEFYNLDELWSELVP